MMGKGRTWIPISRYPTLKHCNLKLNYKVTHEMVNGEFFYYAASIIMTGPYISFSQEYLTWYEQTIRSSSISILLLKIWGSSIHDSSWNLENIHSVTRKYFLWSIHQNPKEQKSYSCIYIYWINWISIPSINTRVIGPIFWDYILAKMAKCFVLVQLVSCNITIS